MSKSAGMSNVTYHPYSDFALHHMGARLSDGINQGAAGPDQFRTAPLWGLGQRLFFLHDGRTSDLMQAIQAHASTDCNRQSCGSEANSCSPQIQFAQPLADAGCVEFPAFVVACWNQLVGRSLFEETCSKKLLGMLFVLVQPWDCGGSSPRALRDPSPSLTS